MLTRANEGSLDAASTANGKLDDDQNAATCFDGKRDMTLSDNWGFADSLPIQYDYVQITIGNNQYKNVIPISQRERFFYLDSMINSQDMFSKDGKPAFYKPNSLPHFMCNQFCLFIPIN